MDDLDVLEVTRKTDLVAVRTFIGIRALVDSDFHQVVEVVVVDGIAGGINGIDPALNVADLALVESEAPEVTLIEGACIVEQHAGLEGLCEHTVCTVPVLLIPKGGKHHGSGIQVLDNLLDALVEGVAGTVKVLVDLLDAEGDRISTIALEDLEAEPRPQEEGLAPPVGLVVSPGRIVRIVDED